MFCWLAYFTSYLLRYDYTASLSEILVKEALTESQAGLVTTALFITYAIGQLCSGVLGDRIKPDKLILYGLAVSSLTNLVFPFAQNYVWMTILWAINGFAQAMLWPPMVRIMAECFHGEEYRKAAVNISVACAASTIGIYLLAPLCIRLISWKVLFFLVSAIGTGITILWGSTVPRLTVDGRVQKEKTQTETNEIKSVKIGHLILEAGLIPIFLAIVAQGVIRDGVSSWTPQLLSEYFSLEVSDSILLTVTLPVLTVVALKVSAWINKRFFKNQVKCSLFLFGIALVSFVILIPMGSLHPVIMVGLAGISVSAIHGVNLMLISELPAYFRGYGKVSTVSGVLNTCTYVGSATSTYGFGWLMEHYGSNTMVIAWILSAAAGVVLAVFALRKWTRFMTKSEL
ncbi:MAG: MFS transporter [Clostridia bacterium]|nr:MFS transporter [Clostridia bacterium]